MSEHYDSDTDEVQRFSDIQDFISSDIRQERIRQNLKFTGSLFGAQAHNIFGWQSILAEEAGEVATAANDYIWDKRYPDPKKRQDIRDELIQTAAVAVAIVERLDANDPSLWEEEPIMKDRHA